MNDEQIMHKGGDEGDIEVYANQHGANLTKLDVEIDEKIQEQQFMTRRNSELIVVNDEPMLAYDGLKLDEQVAANMLVAYNHALKTHHQELQKAREEIKSEFDYIHYNLLNAIRNERDGLNVKDYEHEVDKWLTELKLLSNK